MKTTIRPSMLPGYPDCSRRAAARSFRREIESYGFKLRTTGMSIGAPVGTAVHAGAEITLTTKIKTGGDLGTDADAEDAAIAGLRDALDETEIVTDQLTPNVNTAEKQVRRMTRSYRRHVAPVITPLEVERRLEADLGDDFFVSGQSDVLTMTPGLIRDLKTGAYRPAEAQVGTYMRLGLAHGWKADGAAVDFVRRVSIRKDQPKPEIFEYDTQTILHASEDLIARVKLDLRMFRRAVTTGHARPESVYLANNQSMTCSSKYCPAWGTDFCKLGKPEK